MKNCENHENYEGYEDYDDINEIRNYYEVRLTTNDGINWHWTILQEDEDGRLLVIAQSNKPSSTMLAAATEAANTLNL